MTSKAKASRASLGDLIAQGRYGEARSVVRLVLADAKGSIPAAAAKLGVNRVTLYRWLERLGIHGDYVGRMHPGRQHPMGYRVKTEPALAREEIDRALRESGTYAAAAARLGCAPSRLHAWARELGIEHETREGSDVGESAQKKSNG